MYTFANIKCPSIILNSFTQYKKAKSETPIIQYMGQKQVYKPYATTNYTTGSGIGITSKKYVFFFG